MSQLPPADDKPDFKLEPRQMKVDTWTIERIRSIIECEPFAILCTRWDDQPHGSLVAFAADDDLTGIVFATPAASRKYRLLQVCDRVVLVIDTRSSAAGGFLDIEVITATGRAIEATNDADRRRLGRRLSDRHAYLEAFVSAPTSALFRIDVDVYEHVSRFQEIRAWHLPSRR